MDKKQAFKNIEELIRATMAAGLFKSLADLDLVRKSLQVISEASDLPEQKS